MSTKEEENKPGGCYYKAEPDEPMFVLLARDPLAPNLVEQWAFLRATAIGRREPPASDLDKVEEALLLVEKMRLWKKKHP